MIKKLHNRASALPKLLWLMLLSLLPAQLLAYDFQYEYEGKSGTSRYSSAYVKKHIEEVLKFRRRV